MKRGKKSQAMIDNEILFAAVFVLIIATAFFVSQRLPGEVSDNQITASLINIRDGARAVHNMGPGNKNTIEIELPKNIEDVQVNQNSVSIIKGNGVNFMQSFDFNLVGYLPKNPGKHEIGITSLTGNMVKLGDAPYINSLKPSDVNLSAIPINMTMLGEDLLDVDVQVKVPLIMGSWNVSFSPFYSIVDNKRIELVINRTNPYGDFINPPGDPYYFYAVNPKGEHSNFIEFNVFDDAYIG